MYIPLARAGGATKFANLVEICWLARETCGVIYLIFLGRWGDKRVAPGTASGWRKLGK